MAAWIETRVTEAMAGTGKRLMWVTGHSGVKGNGDAGQKARSMGNDLTSSHQPVYDKSSPYTQATIQRLGTNLSHDISQSPKGVVMGDRGVKCGTIQSSAHLRIQINRGGKGRTWEETWAGSNVGRRGLDMGIYVQEGVKGGGAGGRGRGKA